MIATDNYGNQLCFISKYLTDEYYTLRDKHGVEGMIYLCTDDYIWGGSIWSRFNIQGGEDILYNLREIIIRQYLLQEQCQMSNYIYNIIYIKKMLYEACDDIIHHIVDLLCLVVPKRHCMANTYLIGNCNYVGEKITY